MAVCSLDISTQPASRYRGDEVEEIQRVPVGDLIVDGDGDFGFLPEDVAIFLAKSIDHG
jgi:hypothetical protein